MFSKEERGIGDDAQPANAVDGFVCQSTVIPADGRGFRTPISSQSVGLADTFLGASALFHGRDGLLLDC